MRIRTVKPSFFKHEEIAELHPLTRLLFIGLWCMADKEGRLEYRPKRIGVEILPYDNHDIERALQDLAEGDFLTIYGGDQRLIQINGFHDHQRINGKEAATTSRYPAPTGEDRSNDATSNAGADADEGSTREVPEKQRRSVRDARKGREGKGKEREAPDGAALAREDPPSEGSRYELKRLLRWIQLPSGEKQCDEWAGLCVHQLQCRDHQEGLAAIRWLVDRARSLERQGYRGTDKYPPVKYANHVMDLVEDCRGWLSSQRGAV